MVNFVERKFGKGVFNKERVDYVLSREYLKEFKIFYLKKIPIAYLLAVPTGDSIHIWYSINNALAKEKNFGKYLLLKTLCDAKQKDLKYCYLGTCYGKNARYKADFLGVEFYNGNKWSNNTELLKKLREEDDDIIRTRDIFKTGYIGLADIVE